MPCQKCMVFISDVLLQPPHPSSSHAKHFKQKRLIGCIQPISYLLTRHIEKSRPDLLDWLNMMEMMNCAVLNQSATRNYRMYQILTHEKTDIDAILILLLEHYVLAKCHDKQVYEEWLAEKCMFLFASVRQLHMEHSGPVYQALKVEDDPYNGLYS